MPRIPTDYSKTLIYKFVCVDPEIVSTYVGSTVDFRARKFNHKSDCNNETSKIHHLKVYQFMRANGGWDNFKMIEIEKYPCADKNEARAREQYWIDLQYEKLNCIRAFTTAETMTENGKEYSRQYYQDNKEKLKEYHQQYRQDNKEKSEADTLKSEADTLKAKLYKNTRNYKKKYVLDETLIDKYGIHICHICRLREIIDELPEEMLAKFLAEYKTIELKIRDC